MHTNGCRNNETCRTTTNESQGRVSQITPDVSEDLFQLRLHTGQTLMRFAPPGNESKDPVRQAHSSIPVLLAAALVLEDGLSAKVRAGFEALRELVLDAREVSVVADVSAD